MSAFCSIMMLGNSMGSCYIFLGIIMLIWGFIFIIKGDFYDMRNDVIVSIRKKRDKSVPTPKS